MLWFFVSFRIFFSEFNIRLYDKNSESDYFFFPPPKSEYFFQQHWESEYFFKKIRALRDKKNKYSISSVVRKKILNETKNHGKMHSIIFLLVLFYTEIRLIMMNNLNWVQTSDLNLLTYGFDDLTYE